MPQNILMQTYNKEDIVRTIFDTPTISDKTILILLREQEPRVMMLEEMKSHEVVFMEDYTNSEDGVEPIIRPAIIVEAKNRGLLILDSAYWDDGYVFNTEEDYGKTWRCWTARPTNEQRQAVKWDV